MKYFKYILFSIIFHLYIFLPRGYGQKIIGNVGAHDTILVYAEVLETGEVIPMNWLPEITVYAEATTTFRDYYSEWKRLKNAVYVTYPYAQAAADVINKINHALATTSNKSERKKIIKSYEATLRKNFTSKVKELSVYQGKVMMKLINRQTGNSCYELIQEYKGGFNAVVYQSMAVVFSASLKQTYHPTEDKFDGFIEILAKEFETKYGYVSHY